ncbi:MAG: long-chain N-acyl amino acid synthase [Massilia sp.]|nr:long-chain N-acyl amino acid synthase [Massilia sp.]
MLVDEMPIASFRTPPLPVIGEGRPRTPGTTGTASSATAVHAASQVFNVRLAISAERHADAGVLLRRMYAWRGYAVEAGAREEGNKVTLYAETGGKLVGTMSLCLDWHGVLPADEHFGDRLDILRREGRRLCEPSRLAIDKGMSKRVFASLIHISYLYAHKLHGFTDYVIEVNPRHVAFYRHMLGFADFGAERQCSRVGAPAVLLRLPLDHMAAQIAKWGGTHEQRGGAQNGAERSFYPYFFPVREEPGISARLAALCGTGGRA